MLTLNRAIEVLVCHFELIGAAGAIEKDAWQTLKSHCTQPTDAQQLKAEIAALLSKYCRINGVYDEGQTILFVTAMRQLSAV